MVSGCFDLLHSGHVAFLEEAAALGRLTVCVGADRTVYDLKGRAPINTEEERAFMLAALRCVDEVRVSRGGGLLDFIPELDELEPDIFFVNRDGDSQAKREAVERRGVRYVVAEREPSSGLPARSTTALRRMNQVPYRLDLAGGWLDQPMIGSMAPGPVVNISLEPDERFHRRSGLASSTRNTATQIWGPRIPIDDRHKLGKLLFAFENPPGTKDVSGSQDAIGVVFPGLNRLDYAGEYWPDAIDSVHDEQTLRFVESHLYMIHAGERPPGFDVITGARPSAEGAARLADAAHALWEACLAHDARRFGQAMTDALHAQVDMFPAMLNDKLRGMIDQHPDALGCKVSGAGGGGYLVLVSESPIPDAVRPVIRREPTL